MCSRFGFCYSQVGAQAEITAGDVHLEAEEYQEAVHAYTRAEGKVSGIGGEVLDQARQKLKKANILLEQSKKKEYYKVCAYVWLWVFACLGLRPRANISVAKSFVSKMSQVKELRFTFIHAWYFCSWYVWWKAPQLPADRPRSLSHRSTLRRGVAADEALEQYSMMPPASQGTGIDARSAILGIKRLRNEYARSRSEHAHMLSIWMMYWKERGINVCCE